MAVTFRGASPMSEGSVEDWGGSAEGVSAAWPTAAVPDGVWDAGGAGEPGMGDDWTDQAAETAVGSQALDHAAAAGPASGASSGVVPALVDGSTYGAGVTTPAGPALQFESGPFVAYDDPEREVVFDGHTVLVTAIVRSAGDIDVPPSQLTLSLDGEVHVISLPLIPAGGKHEMEWSHAPVWVGKHYLTLKLPHHESGDFRTGRGLPFYVQPSDLPRRHQGPRLRPV